jgi:glycerol-3-phosphate acyltransferase PlsY
MLGWALILGFVSGSLPFSVWLGQMFLSKDIRQIGDGNPGATNVFRAGSWKVGVVSLLLDYFKGVFPAIISYWGWNIRDERLILVMMAPLLGHQFSPFLGFRGGKGVATTFGVWTGVTLWEGPVVLGFLLAIFYCLLDHDAWSVIFGMIGLLLYWLVKGATGEIYGAALANLFFLLWTHRMALNGKIGVKFRKKDPNIG